MLAERKGRSNPVFALSPGKRFKQFEDTQFEVLRTQAEPLIAHRIQRVSCEFEFHFALPARPFERPTEIKSGDRPASRSCS